MHDVVVAPVKRTSAYDARADAYDRTRPGYPDQVFVAIEGRDRLALEEVGCRIVGYAAVRNHHVLELMVEPGHPLAASQLLVRACADAIEHDHHTIWLHAPPTNTLHDVICQAGGELHVHDSSRGTNRLTRLLQPERVLRAMADDFLVRARSAEVALPLELGFMLDGKKWQLTLADNEAKLVKNRLGRSYVSCNAADFTRLILRYDDAGAAIAAGRLEPSTTLAASISQALLPQAVVWRPPWDHVPA